jgi:hypothetical protein
VRSAWVSSRTADTSRSSALGGIAVSHSEHLFSQVDPTTMNEILKRVALYKYGHAVDAVINVNDQTNPRHDVAATGLAINFTQADVASQ